MSEELAQSGLCTTYFVTLGLQATVSLGAMRVFITVVCEDRSRDPYGRIPYHDLSPSLAGALFDLTIGTQIEDPGDV